MCPSSTPQRRKMNPSDKIKPVLSVFNPLIVKPLAIAPSNMLKKSNTWHCWERGSPTLQYTINKGPEDADDKKINHSTCFERVMDSSETVLQYKSPFNRYQLPLIHPFQLDILIIIVGLFRWSHRKETSTLVVVVDGAVQHGYRFTVTHTQHTA